MRMTRPLERDNIDHSSSRIAQVCQSTMKSLQSLLLLILIVLFIISPGEAGVSQTFCIKPNETTECGSGEECIDSSCYTLPYYSVEECLASNCHTLPYYLRNLNGTINKHNNVTIVFMPGTYPISGVKSVQNITSQTVKVVRKGTVTIIVKCPVCFLSFSEKVTDLTIENLKINSSSGSYALITGNASEVQVTNCVFQGHVLEAHTTNIIITNTTFREYRTIFRKAKALLEGINASNSTFVFVENSNITVGKDSNFTTSSKSAISLSSSNITFSATALFYNNRDVYGGALFLYLSNLIISRNASLIFDSNVALNSGGAMSLSSSHLYIGANANLTIINNSADNKGGAIYIEPGITVTSILVNDQAQTDSIVGCFFHPINCSKDSSQSITLNFENSLAKNGGSDIYGGSLLECSDSTFLCDLAVNNDTSVSSDPLRICICDHDSFGRQQCQRDEFESTPQINVHPGESLTYHLYLLVMIMVQLLVSFMLAFFPSNNLTVTYQHLIQTLKMVM